MKLILLPLLNAYVGPVILESIQKSAEKMAKDLEGKECEES